MNTDATPASIGADALRVAAQAALTALENLHEIDTETECITIDVRDEIDALRAALASTAQPPAPAAQGDAQQRAMHARNSDNALAEGWKEAAIAWEVCASVHRAWGKGRDALFTTRQADYLRHAQMARERHADLTRPTGEAPGSPSESSHDRQLQLVDQRDPARAAKEGDHHAE